METPNKEHFLQSKTVRGMMYGFGFAAAVMLVFHAGAAYGSHRAFFACKWGENYGSAFGDHAGGMPTAGVARPGVLPDKRMGGFHGVLGSIISASDDGVVVKGQDEVERGVVITATTEIRQGKEMVTREDLLPGTEIMTFGEPDEDGRITAKLIRILNTDQQP